jgi:hypothetical protein
LYHKFITNKNPRKPRVFYCSEKSITKDTEDFTLVWSLASGDTYISFFIRKLGDFAWDEFRIKYEPFVPTWIRDDELSEREKQRVQRTPADDFKSWSRIWKSVILKLGGFHKDYDFLEIHRRMVTDIDKINAFIN